jgi:sugar phosphate isomerase/epimerase
MRLRPWESSTDRLISKACRLEVHALSVKGHEAVTGRGVLWSATLGETPLPERIDAAAENGFCGLTVRPDDLERLVGEGLQPAAVAGRARDAGVSRFVVESFSEWYDHEPPRVPFPSADKSIDDHIATLQAFDSADICIVAPFRTSASIHELTDNFAVLCNRVAGDGVSVHLEFTPFRPIESLRTAWEIVRGADCANGGILLDTWHFFRGSPEVDLIRSIPGDRFFSIQVSDGAAELKEGLVQDTFHHRLLPGDGVFDLEGVLRALREIGALNLVGPEVLSTELDSLDPMEAARRAGAAIDRVLGGL